MAEQENLQTVREGYAAFAGGDMKRLLEQFTDDVVWEVPGSALVPQAGIYQGKDGVARFFQVLSETEDPEAFEPQRFFADGDMVVVLGRYAARVKSTGNHVQSDWVHVFTLRDGKVCRYQIYLDTEKYAQAYETAATLT